MTNNNALVIPAELRAHFTDAQAEELVAQFEQSDADGSGSIDEREFRALLARMSLSVTDAEAGELVASIDTNGNGLIDFAELVAMVVQLKQGDARFQALKHLLDALDTTPVAMLEREAKKFGLRIEYQLVAERKATASTPPQFVMELVIAGKWCGARGAETLQAFGKTTREAKFKAAEAGLARVKKLKPGLAYELGHLPAEWEQWLFENIERGTKARKLLSLLVQKGFAPANSVALMQRISTRISSYRLRTRHSAPASMYATAADTGTGRAPAHALHPKWAHWAQQELTRGIDGRTVLQELVAWGLDAAKSPLFTQQLLRGAGSSAPSGACRDPASPSRTHGASAVAASTNQSLRQYSFLACLERGEHHEVELFVCAGQDVDALVLDPETHTALAPLHIAVKHDHTAVVRLLLDHGADVDVLDASDRSPLMVAARNRSTAICDVLLQHHASVFCRDKLDQTPLHTAAYGGAVEIVSKILAVHDDLLLLHIASLPRIAGVSYRALLESAFDTVMALKLRENERRRFHIAWVFDAALWLHDQLVRPSGSDASRASASIVALPRPQRFYIDYLVTQHHDKFTKQQQLAAADDATDADADDVAPDASDWITRDEVAFYLDKSVRETFKHVRTKQGRTALHVACDENLACTHEQVIACLANDHGVSPLLRDYSNDLAIDLVLTRRGRPGSPPIDAQRERQLVCDRDARCRTKQQRLEAERIAERRALWQREVEAMASDFDELETLAAMHKAAKAQPPLEHVSGWQVYLEPLSGNRLFENAASGFVQRQVPAKVLATSSERLGWKEKLALASHFVERNRHVPAWELHRVNSSDLYFFFHRETLACQWLKPADAPKDWRTKRIFDAQDLLDDVEDQASLVIAFSNTVTPAITADAKRGRRLGDWRECTCFGVTFYLRQSDDGSGDVTSVSLSKPPDVLRHESYRYAQVRIRARSEEIEEVRIRYL